MNDVTQILNRYRECVRNLWNIYFINHGSLTVDWDLADEYERICTKLFTLLVLNRVGKNEHSKSLVFNQSSEPLSFFRVVPSAEGGVPIQVSRERNDFTYWDYPIKSIKPDEADMRFIDFFNFGLLDFREFKYCRVRIVGSKVNADLVGRDALLECDHIIILFDDLA